MTQNITIHTDGSCQGNPGPGGWAAIIEIPDWMNATLRGGDPQTTNNRMELTAAIEGLRKLERITGASEEPVVLRSDSKYLCDAFNQGWIRNWQHNGWKTAKKEPVKNRDLWEELEKLASGKKIAWTWVKGHSGDHFNELCDRIAKEEAETAARQGKAGFRETREESQDNDSENAADTQPAREAGPSGPEPVQAGTMQVLELVFTAAADATSFEDFQERMNRLQKSIDWQPPCGSSPAWEDEYADLPF